MEGIRATISKVTEELIEVAGLRKGQILVVGCSTSEILGNRIGTTGDPHLAREVMEGLREVLEPRGLNLAAQGCEHINRALVVERRVMEAYGLTEVWVHPVPHAGGAFASEALKVMEDPVVVESVQAHAGMDIGNTLIGMHLRPVAVPVRVSEDRIGRAALVLARTRPRLVGGARARYKGDKEERFKKGSE